MSGYFEMSKIELMCALKGTVFGDHENLLENKPFTRWSFGNKLH